MVQGRPTVAGCNVVHNDEIWKDHVHHEYTAMKKWPETWGFLKDEYKQLKSTICTERDQWTTLHSPGSPPASPPSPSQQDNGFTLPPLQPPKQHTSNPFPMTTSREVGWRSTRKENKLEIYGRWGRGKGSILKHLNWPNDAVP